MAKIKLTELKLKNLEAAEKGKRYILWDGDVSGLGVRVTDKVTEPEKKPKRSFVFVGRRRGDPRPIWTTLGEYDERKGVGLKLGQARIAAREVLRVLDAGQHPREVEEEKRREKARLQADTFGLVAEEFIKRHVGKLRRGKDTESLIYRELLGQQRVNGEWVVN